MPRGKPKKKSATGLNPAADVMEELNEQGADLRPASELPRQLTPPEPILEPLLRAEPEPPSEPPSHVAAVLARRPNFAPVPNGFRNVMRHEAAGIRVNRGVDKQMGTLGAAGIQFSEDRPLSRANEYGLMEKIQSAGFQFQPKTRQWQRPFQEGMELGDNAIEAVSLAKEIADARCVERGR